MRRKLRRVASVAAVAGAGGVMLISPNFSCESFAGESLFTAVNTCFIFDCQNGAFGGLLNPCDTPSIFAPAGGESQIDPSEQGPLFADCFGQTGFQGGP